MMPRTPQPALKDHEMNAAEVTATIGRPQPAMQSNLHPSTLHQSKARAEVRIRSVTGFDSGEGGFPRRLNDQCRQALRNGAESLACAGLSMQDVVQVTYLMQDADAFPTCFALLRHAFGDARPGATLRLVGGFDEPDMQIELELVARRGPTVR